MANKLYRSVPELLLRQSRCSISTASALASKKSDSKTCDIQFNDQQASYYTAKDIEFSPNRAREVMQNHVQEVSENSTTDDHCVENKKRAAASNMGDEDHVEAYKSGSSVSLYSVMQSNVPDPFTTSDKAPTHLNMPGSSSSQGYKYLSEMRQKAHQSKQ